MKSRLVLWTQGLCLALWSLASEGASVEVPLGSKQITLDLDPGWTVERDVLGFPVVVKGPEAEGASASTVALALLDDNPKKLKLDPPVGFPDWINFDLDRSQFLKSLGANKIHFRRAKLPQGSALSYLAARRSEYVTNLGSHFETTYLTACGDQTLFVQTSVVASSVSRGTAEETFLRTLKCR